MDEESIRKQIWDRRAAVDAKVAETGFAALSPDERDAWVVSLQLDLPLDVALHGVSGVATAEEKSQLWAAFDETFKYGKRKALRALKEVLARHKSLRRPEVAKTVSMVLFAMGVATTVLGGSVTVQPGADLTAAVTQACATPGPREVVLTAGDYYLKAPLALASAQSNLVVCGAGAEKTRLIGGIPVTGWQKEEGSPYYKATLPEGTDGRYAFRMLLKNGHPAPIAVYPGGTNRLSHLGEFKVRIMSSLQGGWQRPPTVEERTKMPYRAEDLPDTMDLANADIRLFHMWSDSLCTVSNVDRKAHILWTSQPASWAMGAENRRQYEVLNVREGMTMPGQWYLERAKGVLHYWPLPGEDVAQLKFVAPTLPSVVTVAGTLKWKDERQKWAHNITLRDFAISAAAPSVREMSSFGGSQITAALTATCTSGLRLENLVVQGVGGAGLLVDDAAHAAIVNCDIRETGARGLGMGGWAGTGDNLIASNRIADVGLVYRSSCGMATYGTNLLVRANEICRIPYCGIIGGGSDNIYEENYIHHVMQFLHDGGAIYGNLTRCILRRNVVHDITPDGKGYGVHAYYADEGSRDCLVEDNYAEGVAVPIHNHMTFRTVVRGNTLVSKGDLKISFARSFDCAFSNNTLVANGKLELGDPDAVPHWSNNRAIRPSQATDAASRREIGLWEPARPQQRKRWASSVEHLAKAPTLDGRFSTGEWPLNWMTLANTADRHASGFTAATVRFAWDNQNLYASFMTSAFKNSRISLGDTWGKDDGVELVFAGGRRIRAFFSGTVKVENLAGVQSWAGKNPDIKKPWENQNRANYEFAIPWSALGLTPKTGLKVPFNACAYMSEFGQYKYWEGLVPYPDGKAADDPAGLLTLAAPPPDTIAVEVTGISFGRGANRVPNYVAPKLVAEVRRKNGTKVDIPLIPVDWMNRFLVWRRLTPDEQKDLDPKVTPRIRLEGGRPEFNAKIKIGPAKLFFEELKPLDIKVTPREQLPFPVAGQSIVPKSEPPAASDLLAQWQEKLPAACTVKKHREGKSLVVDITAPAGAVTEIPLSVACEAKSLKSFAVPYLAFRKWGRRLKAELLEGGWFRLAMFDWYHSQASCIDMRELPDGRIQPVAVYQAKTDGAFNPVRERIVVTLSKNFDEVLPNIPNPKSPWKKEVGSRVWRTHADYNHAEDLALWRAAHKAGFKHVALLNHETMWRDGGEAFTFCTVAAKGKGGDAGQIAYTRALIDELGYLYGPYNNFTDLSTQSDFFSPDTVARRPDWSFQPAWMRCYGPKPTLAPKANDIYARELKRKFGFNTAYCDVHTAVFPWDRTDYDARVPGAGTYAQTFYSYGEVLLKQKDTWQGPVYSEGNAQFLYAGLCDSSYAQDQTYDFRTQPWLVDFELLRQQRLSTDFGMGALAMFSRPKTQLAISYYLPDEPFGRDELIDRFLAATIAFGHAGYLVMDGCWTPGKAFGPAYGIKSEPLWKTKGIPAEAYRSYFMIQALAAKYTQSEAVEIRYLDGTGKGHTTSDALRNGVIALNQVVTRYADGTMTAVNGGDKPMVLSWFGKSLTLPHNGFAGRADGVEVLSTDIDGRRVHFAEGPEYRYREVEGEKPEVTLK